LDKIRINNLQKIRSTLIPDIIPGQQTPLLCPNCVRGELPRFRVFCYLLIAPNFKLAQKEIVMAKIPPIVFSTFVFLTLIVSTACTAEKDLVRAEDRVAIEQLMWDYIQTLDSGNAEAYAALFAPDGQFGRGDSAVKGRDALKKMISDARQQLDTANKSNEAVDRMYHVVTNPHIEFIDKDHARYYAYWMGVFTSGGVTSAGREVNELVRMNGQWLISVRDVDPQD
jgi:uncharacterized protein (TIGR02246 family)